MWRARIGTMAAVLLVAGSGVRGGQLKGIQTAAGNRPPAAAAGRSAWLGVSAAAQGPPKPGRLLAGDTPPRGVATPDGDPPERGGQPCPFPSEHCQPRGEVIAYRSNRTQTVQAEDFLPHDHPPKNPGDPHTLVEISGLCVSGLYFNDAPPATDSFRVVYYHVALTGEPGDPVAGPFTQGTDLAVVRFNTGATFAGRAVFEYTLEHPTAHIPPTCTWVEVTNASGNDAAAWFWIGSDAGNGRHAEQVPGLPGTLISDDLSLCISQELQNPAPCVLPPPPPPPNDSCANATLIGEGTFDFSNQSASTDGPPACGQIGADIWYRFTAPAGGVATVSTCGGTGFDSVLAVYSGDGCTPPGSELACVDDSCGLQTEVSFDMTEGSPYLIRLGGFNGQTGSGTLLVALEPNETLGRLVCSNGDPLGNCPVTLTFLDSSGPVASTTVTTDAGGNFVGVVFGGASNNVNERFEVSTACCGHTWTIPSSCSCGDLGTLTCTACAECLAPPPGMIAWWPFDEAFGAYAEERIGDHNGLHQGSPTHAPGYVGNGLCFDGQSAVVATGAGTHDSRDITVDAWINLGTLPASGQFPAVVRQSAVNAYGLFITRVGTGVELNAVTQHAGGGRAYYTSGANLAAGVWYHVAFTANSATNQVTFYINGVNLGPSPNPYLEDGYGAPVANAWDMGGGFGTGLNGCIDEVEIFTRVLAPGEINAIFAAGHDGKCKSCEAPAVGCSAPPALCPLGENAVFEAGSADNFCAPTEPTNGSCANGLDFDSFIIDRPFCHTIGALPSNLASAALEIRAKAGNSVNSCNDSISLSAGGAVLWSSRLGTGTAGCPSTGLYANPWTAGAVHTFCIDLTSLPGSGLNLVPYLNAGGQLDIFIQDDTAVDYARLWVDLCPPCTPPPRGMVSWWTFDEPSGSLAFDSAGPNTGAITGAQHVPGYVGNALDFTRLNLDRVVVPNAPAFNFGNGDFSFDAWVRYEPSNPPAQFGLTILRKPEAYRVMASPLNTHMHFGPGGEGPYFAYPGYMPPANRWTHIAGTVDQSGNAPCVSGGNTTVVRYYNNGVLWGTTCIPAFNFTTPDDLAIGSRHPLPLPHGWDGLIDEVELFNRVLDPAEIAAIHAAGPMGKCKHDCHAPWDVEYCLDDSSVTIQLGICSYAPLSVANTYLVSIHGLPPSACGTTVQGPAPSDITFLDPNPVTIGGQTCVPLRVQIQRPAGLNAGDSACFEVRIVNLDSGQVVTCRGTLVANNDFCDSKGKGNTGGSGILGIAVGPPRTIDFAIQNTSAAPALLRYQVVAMTDHEPSPVISLDGLEPGKPVSGERLLVPGETADLAIDVRFLSHSPFGFHDLIFSIDADGDGDYEPLSSRGVRSLPALCPGDFVEDFDSYALGPVCPQGGWEPWVGQGDTCFSVTTDRPASGGASLFVQAGLDAIGQGNDTLHRLSAEGGRWTFRTMTYVPDDATGRALVILLNTYNDPPFSDNFSTLLRLNADNNLVSDDFSGAVAPLVRGRWAELRAEIDLDALPQPTVDYFYDGQLFAAGRPWNPGGGRREIDAVDFYGEVPGVGTSGMYFDDVSLRTRCDPAPPDPCPPDWNNDGLVNSNDFFDFLASYFAGDADFNNDGQTDSNDFFAFLTAFFEGC